MLPDWINRDAFNWKSYMEDVKREGKKLPYVFMVFGAILGCWALVYSFGPSIWCYKQFCTNIRTGQEYRRNQMTGEMTPITFPENTQ